MLKHIVFDCDGVLWEGTNEGYVKCYYQAARDAGIDLDYALARERILAHWGRSAQQEIEAMIPEHLHRVEEVEQRYRRHIRSDLFLSTAALVPGARETLQALSRCYALSAVTGMDADNLRTLLRRFELRGLLQHTISTGETNDPAQQKGTGYHLGQLLSQEALAPHEALCVGDAPVDVEMARRQQVPVVVVLTGHLDEHAARKLNVRHILASVADLPAWLAGNGSAPQAAGGTAD